MRCKITKAEFQLLINLITDYLEKGRHKELLEILKKTKDSKPPKEKEK